MKIDVTVSIVAFNTKPDVINKAISSCLLTQLNIQVYIYDNSPTPSLSEKLTQDTRIFYIFNNDNLGFGKAHNLCICRNAIGKSKFHVVLNPDVYFESGVLDNLFAVLEANEAIGLAAPQILYPNNQIQYSCRLLPAPIDLIIRRLPLFNSALKRRIWVQELRFTNYNFTMEVPFLLGCFLFIRTSALEKVGIFDERYFMYLEDVDLCRRIHVRFKTLFLPNINVYHTYEKGSSKNFTLLLYHIKSMIKYFNKWGWFNDKERNKINRVVLHKLAANRNNLTFTHEKKTN